MSLCMNKNCIFWSTIINATWLDFVAFINFIFINSKELIAEKHAKNCAYISLAYSFLLFYIYFFRYFKIPIFIDTICNKFGKKKKKDQWMYLLFLWSSVFLSFMNSWNEQVAFKTWYYQLIFYFKICRQLFAKANYVCNNFTGPESII